MTLKESYQNTYASKNKAIKAQLSAKRSALSAQKKRLKEQGSEALRAAYADYMRAAVVAEQQNRADGRFGGAADNQKAGLGVTHTQKRAALQADTAADVAAVEEKLSAAEVSASKAIADNQTALRQKLDRLAIKEAEAAAKTTAKASKATGGKGAASAKELSKAQALSMMKMGIYDQRFAQILGIADEDVQYYVRYAKLRLRDEIVEQEKDTRLPGTYKPPLK